MSAHHFFTAPDAITDSVVTLNGAEAHHATKALRVRVGEAITVADGSGRFVRAEVTSVGEVVEADVVESRVIEAVRPEIVLCQALTKGDKFELVVEKATEVGVRRIVPFMAQRTVVKWDRGKENRAVERWTQIAISAAKQSRSPWLVRVDPIVRDLASALDGVEHAFVLHENASTRLRDVLPDPAPDELTLVVGPEGGLSELEVSLAGSRAVCLGPQVLRTETAGVVAATIVGYTYGWMG